MRGTGGRLVGVLVTALTLAACKQRPADKHDGGHHHRRHDAGGAGAPAIPAADPWTTGPAADCERLPFATSIPVAEASGAAWLTGGADGDVVLVVGDSGHTGDYVELAADDGRVIRRGKLPLGAGAGDDLEGIATDGERLWGLTSAGWMRAWVRDGTGFRLVLGPYPIEQPPPCAAESVNCGHNFEGLCLRPVGSAGADGCIGYAAAKAEGALYCLWTETPAAGKPGDGDPRPRPMLAVRDGHKTPKANEPITDQGALADCAIAGDGAVWTGDNAFGGGTVRRLDAPAWSASLGDGFPEAMALAPDGIVYRFSDTSIAPSLAARFRCPAAKAGPATGTLGSAAPTGR